MFASVHPRLVLVRSATIRLAACSRACSSVNLEIRWLDSGKSTWIARTCITTPWNSPMGRSCWSPVCAKASGRPCCSCRPLRGSRAKRKSKCTALPSPELSHSPPSGPRDGLLRASRVKRIAGRVLGERHVGYKNSGAAARGSRRSCFSISIRSTLNGAGAANFSLQQQYFRH